MGHLGADPEIRIIPGGLGVGTLRIATDSKWTDKSGKTQDATEWHRVVVWGRLAEIAQHYLKKGRQVYVEGRLQTREWQDRAGQKRQTTEIVVSNLQLIAAKSADAATSGESESTEATMPPEAVAELQKF
jgi:single-strand DNA-binding protein